MLPGTAPVLVLQVQSLAGIKWEYPCQGQCIPTTFLLDSWGLCCCSRGSEHPSLHGFGKHQRQVLQVLSWEEPNVLTVTLGSSLEL